jgi:PAS domain S-box-containing protein
MKRLNNLFEEIFTDFSKDSQFDIVNLDESLQGWLWECDDSGKYLSCSPEVEDVLGYSPKEIIGQPLKDFALVPKSTRKIANILKMGNLPAEISVDFIKQDGEKIPVSLFIYDAITTEHKNTGLRGFAQVLIDTDKVPRISSIQSTPTKESMNNDKSSTIDESLDHQLLVEDSELQESEEFFKIEGQRARSTEINSQSQEDEHTRGESTIQAVSKLIIDRLEKIRHAFPVIKDSPLSRVISFDREEFRIDRSREPLVNESIAGKAVHYYPKTLIREIEHRLEWGIKFDFTDEEKTFLSRYRLRPSGIQGFLRYRTSPKTILKCDYDWVSVVILYEQRKTKRIWVNYLHKGKKIGGWSLEEVIREPNLVFNEIEKAVLYPNKEREILIRGENYLFE